MWMFSYTNSVDRNLCVEQKVEISEDERDDDYSDLV
jgi:hypothetical protein